MFQIQLNWQKKHKHIVLLSSFNSLNIDYFLSIHRRHTTYLQ